MGIEALKDMYVVDPNFGDIYKVCMEFGERYHADFPDFLIQDKFLFKGGQLCVPRCSMRTNIIKEKHSGTMGGHFGLDKTLELVRRYYYWLKLQTDVRNFVETCMICQRAKGRTTNAGLYQPLPIPSRP